MKPLKVKCPQCKEVSDLLLGSEAYMIVLHCPACSTSLMYYYGKTFEIDEREMEKIQGNLQMTSVQGVLKNTRMREQVRTDAEPPPEFRPSHKAGSPIREYPLGRDDITNLKIELALNNDAEEFIRSL